VAKKGRMNESIEKIDPYTYIIYLEVPGSRVVLLQAQFELYEGLGTVRTLDIKNSLVCIIATPTTLDDCLKLLDALKEQIHWRFAPIPDPEKRDMYLGYFKQRKDA
jgi:hypothetical protein